MKVGAFLLFIFHVRNALSSDTSFVSKGLYSRSLPKKNLQLLIGRKVFKTKQLKLKKPEQTNNEYTVFPPMGDVGKPLNIPESPFFPVHAQEPKTRVKKVLQDYVLSGVRKKRSADVTTQDVQEKTTIGLPKASEEPNSNKTFSRRSLEKKNIGRRDKLKRGNRLKGRKRVMRNSNGTRPKPGKRLRYTKRPAQKQKGNNTKAARKSGKSRKQNAKPKATTKKDLESRRLIAARDALIEEYPYVVSIQKNGEHWCAGALLNPRIVITTANCVWKSSRMSRLKIRAGSRISDQGGQTAYVQETRKHPDWSIRKNPDNDVALLLLDRNIRFSDSVHGVDLPNRIMLPAFEDAWVTSWGAERRDGVYDKKSMTLQSFHTRLMDKDKCNNVTQRFGVSVTDNFICLSQEGNRAPCTRDTGAPAVSDGVLWGLASWGIRKLCGTQRFPAMFSYMASQTNMDFIANATHELMSDERLHPFPDRYPVFRSGKTSSAPNP